MAFVFGALLLFRIAVHSFTDEEIGADRIPYDAFCWTGICHIGETDSLSFCPHDQVGGKCSAVFRYDGLSFLQRVPVFLVDFRRQSGLHIEFSLTGQVEPITITGDIVMDFECGDGKVRQESRFRFVNFFGRSQFMEVNGEGELRCNDQKRFHHMLQSLRTNNRNRRCFICIAHR